MTLGEKLLSVFEVDEVLDLKEIGRRSGYGHTTVTCYMADLARGDKIWRVAHGRYSLSPRAKSAVFTLKDRVLEAFRDGSFVTSRHVARKTGVSSVQVSALAGQLVREGKLFKVRWGVYSPASGARPLPTPAKRGRPRPP